MPDTDLRYPVGRFARPAEMNEAGRAGWIEEIAAAPQRMRAAVEGLAEEQLDTPYRPGGWTVRQVVHHLPDSHLNAYVRCKLALTEETPAIRTYEEARWAELPEARSAPVDVSLALLDSLHARWVLCLRQLPAEAFARTWKHPQWGLLTLDDLLGLYAWHGRHHVAHVTALRERMGWNGGEAGA
ncbi:MAG TPA: putative metal-dependent hydrolase [Thermoanaerobaculia bacterium]|nr:putative metal-dependent hydrolase [Thermoanaerobaculia bacterium]